ncbi:MAG: IclR family transcriptional regulator [Variovorax sp.]|jgi:IclR family KDG regulon transcriptional repressor|nr:IclR family transcriptional regulator [Variovorax sp.]
MIKQANRNTIEDGGAPTTTRAPLRAMQVIAALAAQSEGLSLAQLSDQLQLPKTSLFSLLRSLDSGGYIESSGGHHRLGREAYSLASAISRVHAFPVNVHSTLERLHRLCGETVMLAVPGDGWADLVYVDVIEADSWLRFRASVGSRRPLYCTAPGLALLSFSDAATRAHYVNTVELKRYTPDTVSSKRALAQLLATTTARGLAISCGSVEDATGVAAPIFDAAGKVFAAVSLAGLTTRVSRNIDQLSAFSRQAGEQMSRVLGYSGKYPGEH